MTRERSGPVLATVCVAFFLTMLDTTVVTIALPDIQHRLDASLTQALWVVNGYTLVFAALLLPFGRLGDRYTPRAMFLAGLATFTVASAWCGLAPDAGQLIAARGLQGAGAAMLMPQTLTLIATTFPAERRGFAFGVWSGVAGLATVAGPAAGGLLVDTLTWRSVFLLNLPLGLVALAAGHALIPRQAPRRGHAAGLDLVGMLLSTGGLFLTVFALLEEQWYAGGAGLVLLTGFVLHQRTKQAGSPLVPFELFGRRNFTLMNAVLMAALFATVALLLIYTLYLQSVRDLTPAEAGLILAPPAVATLLISPVMGRLADRVDPRFIVPPGLALFAAGFLVLLAASGDDTDVLWLLPGMIGCGAGAGLVFAPANALALRDVPPAMAGAASGVVSTLRQVGTLLGAVVVGAVLRAGGTDDYTDAMPAAIWTVVGVLVLTAIATTRIRPPSERQTP
ncbi:MFS transporter [Jiangella alba]|uniref:Drug resistance transporter, EmrB/QacA subfamily n=1 Tax=Jiangella alba TaxID=561176 RepID=A0A1H5PYX2_9ACTN|nr:MFS transporter [Jiangella alba]SEF18899.1 drug resistance transporter, EmrB/QacA subfamily [Jiangella alba]